MIGWDQIEEHYSLSAAIAACWKLADHYQQAECILEYQHKQQTDGTPIYGIASGSALDQCDNWRADWEVIGIRDPAIWLKHQPEFRFTRPLGQQR